MDRFLTNLDLRDIKVGPESSFPPTGEGLDVPIRPDVPEPVQVTIASVGAAVDGQSRDVLKVSAKSRPSAVAGAIAGVVREAKRAEVQAIGAGATNQAVKAIAIARDYLVEDEIDMICIPEFIDIIIDNEERTAIRFVIEPR
jgi:stage V sporulation protein S